MLMPANLLLCAAMQRYIIFDVFIMFWYVAVIRHLCIIFCDSNA